MNTPATRVQSESSRSHKNAAIAYVVGMIAAMMVLGLLLALLMTGVGLTPERRGGELIKGIVGLMG